jgi:hypothetical protein
VCGVSFVERVLLRRRATQRCWFLRWLLRGETIGDLSRSSKLSPRTVRRIIRYWLNRSPVATHSLSAHGYLIVDSTYLKRRSGALTVVIEATAHRLVAGAFGVHEGQGAMEMFLHALAVRGLQPKAVTTDGSPGLLRYLRSQWPEAILQRCLVHIQRQGLSWCRRKPKRTNARRLRKLFLRVTDIHTPEQRDSFLDDLVDWERRYGDYVEWHANEGYVFTDLKRARSMLWHAVPDMFHYLDDPAIPDTNNAVEGYFGRLKKLYRQHPGLRPAQRAPYFQWLLHELKR